MATIFDLIEVTGIFANTTYSETNGNLLGVVDGAVSSAFDDGEFDENDVFTLGGQTYRIDLIQEPASSGRFVLGDGTNLSFDPQHESNLDVVFLTVSNTSETRYFVIPSDDYGDMNVQEIRTGSLTDVAGSDAALVSTQNHAINVVCFTGETLIGMADGTERRAEDLSIGDLVLTQDSGAQPIRGISRQKLGVATMLRHPRLRPVRIGPNVLAPGIPSRDLRVSPQHRILVRSRIASRMFGSDEVLVAAKHLVGVNGVDVDRATWSVTYVHFMFDRHEIVFADGAPCESLWLGPQALATLGPDPLGRVKTRMDREDAMPSEAVSPSRPLVDGHRARKMSERHRKNAKALLDTAWCSAASQKRPT